MRIAKTPCKSRCRTRTLRTSRISAFRAGLGTRYRETPCCFSLFACIMTLRQDEESAASLTGLNHSMLDPARHPRRKNRLDTLHFTNFCEPLLLSIVLDMFSTSAGSHSRAVFVYRYHYHELTAGSIIALPD